MVTNSNLILCIFFEKFISIKFNIVIKAFGFRAVKLLLSGDLNSRPVYEIFGILTQPCYV